MKRLKIIFVTGLLALVSVFGFFLPVVSVSADEVSTSTEISVESHVEGLDGEWTFGDLTEYLDGKKNEEGKIDLWAILKDLKTWIIAGIGSISSILLVSVYAAIVGHFKNKGEINIEKNTEKIAVKAAADAVKGLVGSAINLDVSAEVNKAVETFMYHIKNELDDTFDIVKNTEILTAEIANALSKSRLLTKEEQTQLKGDADAVIAHAKNDGAAIKAPAAVVVKEEQKTVDNQATAQKTDVTPENGYTLNFGGI